MRRYTKRNKNGEKLNFWLSYSDMMAALLLVFILILSCTLLETRATYEAKPYLDLTLPFGEENERSLAMTIF